MCSYMHESTHMVHRNSKESGREGVIGIAKDNNHFSLENSALFETFIRVPHTFVSLKITLKMTENMKSYRVHKDHTLVFYLRRRKLQLYLGQEHQCPDSTS